MTAKSFQAQTGVSRETLGRLERYAGLLGKWQRAINLVSPATLPDLWRRHMLDSAQLRDLAPPPPLGRRQIWLDIGSGAGFPGMVLAILGVGEVHLVESDTRKCAFLRAVAQETGTEVQIHHCRLETLPAMAADVITARAFAPLGRLLPQAIRFSSQDTVCLFPKGQDVDKELTAARKDWTMQVEFIASRSDPSGTILRIGGVTHV